MNQFRRPEEDRAAATGEIPDRKLFEEPSRQHESKTRSLVSMRIEPEPGRIKCIGQSQIAEFFGPAHVALNV